MGLSECGTSGGTSDSAFEMDSILYGDASCILLEAHKSLGCADELTGIMGSPTLFAEDAMASGVATVRTQRVQQNYMAILVAAIACFLLEAGWYSYFMQAWLNGIGRTSEWLHSAAGYNPALQFGTALLMAAFRWAALRRAASHRMGTPVSADQRKDRS